jgi:glycosyltransferase involved in cell wall biosynthesis
VVGKPAIAAPHIEHLLVGLEVPRHVAVAARLLVPVDVTHVGEPSLPPVTSSIRSVVLNALFLQSGQSGGPETYLRGLVPALAREFAKTRFVVVTTRAGAVALHRDGWTDFAEIDTLPADHDQRARRMVCEQVVLPRRSRRRGFDVLHSLASIAPVWTATPSVITLHDVTFLRIRTLEWTTTLAFRMTVVPAARRADALVTGSVAARDEICSMLGLDRGRFFVVPHGPGRLPGVPADEEAIRAAFDLVGRRVILCVAAKRPHKNQELLIRALTWLSDDVVVVLVGHPESYDAGLRALAAELEVAGRVRFVDFVPDAELEALWRIAKCTAFPTLGEGFGLPVLEAMARGVPVACSDIAVLREVGGEVPFYFDPGDPRSAAGAITAALANGERIPAGKERASAFTWENAASGTFEAYERAVASARS